MKLRVLVVLFLLATGITLAHAQTTSNCPNSTVADARGAEFASRAKAFLGKLQEAVKQNDAKQFAALVAYPVRVIDGTHRLKVATAAELIQKYPALMTPKLKQAILNQSATCLFGNDQGAMIGDGQVWFDEQPGGAVKIITINLTAGGS
jgi:hypothetical protein